MVWVSSGIVGVLERVLSRLPSHSGVGIVLGKLRNLGVAAAVNKLHVRVRLSALLKDGATVTSAYDDFGGSITVNDGVRAVVGSRSSWRRFCWSLEGPEPRSG
jgi:hypothetical protein